MVASLTGGREKKNSFPNLSKQLGTWRSAGEGGTTENLGNWFTGREKLEQELYSLDLHHRGTIVLRNELEMVPRRFALALEFRDVRCQLVEIDFRSSRYRADLKAKPCRRCRDSCSICLQDIRGERYSSKLIKSIYIYISHSLLLLCNNDSFARKVAHNWSALGLKQFTDR